MISFRSVFLSKDLTRDFFFSFLGVVLFVFSLIQQRDDDDDDERIVCFFFLVFRAQVTRECEEGKIFVLTRVYIRDHRNPLHKERRRRTTTTAQLIRRKRKRTGKAAPAEASTSPREGEEEGKARARRKVVGRGGGRSMSHSLASSRSSIRRD